MTKTPGLIDAQVGSQAAPAQRRSQAERSADTRTRVIDAAIQCLYEVGYSATTTGLVVSRAGVSPGAMTHQFPSKADLMEAVVSAVYEDELKEYERLAQAGPTPDARRLLWISAPLLGDPQPPLLDSGHRDHDGVALGPGARLAASGPP